MNTHLKNVLGIAQVVVLFMFGFSAMKYVDAYDSSTQPDSFRSFQVSGEGKVVAVPDIAQFSFSVISEGGTDIAALQKKNTEKMNGAIAFLKKNKVDKKDIQTSSYNVSPRYERCDFSRNGGKCPPPQIIGYTVNQRVTTKVRDFDKIGDILSGIVKAGVNNVSQLQFTIDDPSSLETKARAKAIEQAKAKAEELASAGGFRIGKLLNIDENGMQPFYRTAKAEFAQAFDEGIAVSAPTIAPGSQEVRVEMHLTFEIK